MHPIVGNRPGPMPRSPSASFAGFRWLWKGRCRRARRSSRGRCCDDASVSVAHWSAVWRRWALVTVGVAFGLGCPATNYFACEEDSECANADGGQCEAAGACSFPDDDCDSGRRYGNGGPPHLAGDCVPVEGTTGGVGTTTISTGSQGSEGSDNDDGTTVAVDEGGSSSGGAGTSTGGLDPETTTSSGDASSSSGDSGGSSSTGVDYPPGSQDIYEPCAEAEDCISGTCLGFEAEGVTYGFCSDTCGRDGDCPQPDIGAVATCVPVMAGVGGEELACLLACTVENDCLPGTVCAPVPGTAGICAAPY